MASAGPPNPDAVSAKVKTLINNQLKQILKKEGLAVSGAKAILQQRIISRKSATILCLNMAYHALVVELHQLGWETS